MNRKEIKFTLVIYDTTEKIYYQASGDVQEPSGIPFLWVEVPDGKYITGVDVSGDTPTVILGDIKLSSHYHDKIG